jgi:DNA-binding winged helix-turn-helix (wHTH) protein/TolB-like protein
VETISFGRFEVNLQKRAISRSGIAVRLAPQPFTILAALLEARGAIVSREELRRRLWPDGTFLEYEQATNVAIRRLREVLGESNSNPIYIETIPRVGYRWIGPLQITPQSSDSGTIPPPNAQDSVTGLNSKAPAALEPEHLHDSVSNPSIVPPTPPRKRTWKLLFGVTALGMTVILGILLVRGRMVAPSSGAVIVLSSFECVGCTADQAYLAPGIADRLASNLIRIPGVHVLESLDAAPNPPVSGAAKLILTVRVISESSSGIAVTVFLTSSQTHEQLWSNHYETLQTGVPALELEMANDIFRYLRPLLPPQDKTPFKATWTRDPIAYDWYLRGRDHLVNAGRVNTPAAIREFSEAIRRDPGFAAAYGGLARANLMVPAFLQIPMREAMPLVKMNALKEIELDPSAPDGRASLALEELFFEFKWQSAEREFQQAIALNPDNSLVHSWYASLLSDEGREAEAIREAKIGVSLDPNEPRGDFTLAKVQLNDPRTNADCIETCRSALQRHPDNTRIRDVLVFAFWRAHRYEEAADENLQMAEITRDETAIQFQRSAKSILATKGPAQYALAQARYCEPRDGMDYACDAGTTAEWYAMGGDAENTFRMLRKTVDNRDPNGVAISFDVSFVPFRSDRRFHQLVSEIHPGSD